MAGVGHFYSGVAGSPKFKWGYSKLRLDKAEVFHEYLRFDVFSKKLFMETLPKMIKKDT